MKGSSWMGAFVGLCTLLRSLAAADQNGPGNSFNYGPGQTAVQLFEWSWDDVAKECELWLGPKGFTAVQVSPASEHTQGDSWQYRYQPVSFKLSSRGGDETQFRSMVQRCQDAGVSVYADAVFNQMAVNGGVGIGGTQYGRRAYAGYFGPDDFHHLPNNSNINCGVDNYRDAYNVQYCDLLGMPDVCTGCPHVQAKIAAYINHMASLGIDGFRVDAAKHQAPKELRAIMDKVNSSLYRFMEVLSTPGEVVQANMYTDLGQVTEVGYAAVLGPKFREPGFFTEEFFEQLDANSSNALTPSDKAVVFWDNHDSQRSVAPLTYKNGDTYTLANVFMLAYPYGYPRVMSSYYFTDPLQGPPGVPVHGPHDQFNCADGHTWVCEHRRLPIANMVAWRRVAGHSPVTNMRTYGNMMSFCRGDQACVALNRLDTAWSAVLPFTLPAGVYCDIIQSDESDCPTVRVHSDGQVHVTVPPQGAVALHVLAQPKPSRTNGVFAQPEPSRTNGFAVIWLPAVCMASLLLTVLWRLRVQQIPSEDGDEESLSWLALPAGPEIDDR